MNVFGKVTEVFITDLGRAVVLSVRMGNDLLFVGVAFKATVE